MRSLEAAHRGFALVGSANFISEYNAASVALDSAIQTLRDLTKDNPAQQKRIADLFELVHERIRYTDSTNALRYAGNTAAATDAIRIGSQSSVRLQINEDLNAIAANEKRLLQTRADRVATSVRTARWLTIAGVIVSTLLVLLSIWLIRIESRRRRAARADLAASEERLRDFLDSASDLIQSSTPDGTLIYANRSLLDTLGYSAHEVIGKSGELLFAPEELEHGRELFERIVAGETVNDIETIYLRKDGRRVHVAGSSNCRFENGKPVATRTILHDVTRQREVDHLKDEFVSIVSHELRTPLTSIRGALGLLANGMLGDVSDRGKRMLDVAITNTDRLVRLINDILDVERIESGAVPMARRRVALADILTNVEEVMRPYADKAGVRLNIGRLDVDLNVDADRIVQTLVNLLSNAVKFSRSGSLVRLEVARELEDVHIRVCDEGRGIPGDMLEKVFVRFQQVDASDAREKGGSGLGLSISRSIVQQHDGRIWAESKLGSGSTFHVLLPIMPRANDAQSRTGSENGPAPLVLVCDDDEDVRTVVTAMLQDRGYRVIAAEDGITAVELASRHRPAVMLLDLLMPGEYDGWRTMAVMKDRDDTRDIPVIIVSGSGEGRPAPADSEEQKRMRKPVDSTSLIRAIEQALSQWGAGANVLVVEDDIDLARILLEFLRAQGLRPAHACDGREAVQLSQKLNPSLIILDLMLPDTDGFAVVDWLRQHDRLRDTPIMVYTARDLDDEQRARLAIAPELLFTKSRMPPEELVERVASMVGRMTWDQDQNEI
jgi:PAS domain S-box-containing protein